VGRVNLSRRRFLWMGGSVVGAAAGLGVYAWRVEPHWVEFVSRPLPIAGLPDDLAGRTLVQLSDLHAGPQVDPQYLRDTLRAVTDLDPDLVVYTGDLVTLWDPMPIDTLAYVLEAAPRGRLGTFAVLGNHDFGPQWRHMEIAAEVQRRAEAAGMTVLRNECATAAGLQIVGFDDIWGPNFDPAKAFGQVDGGLPTIFLCHNPDAADLDVWQGHRGWILAGHTHGGQCKPPFLPPPVLPVRNRRYVAGEFELSGGRRMYINRGVGHLVRIRFNARPEVTLFRLVRA